MRKWISSERSRSSTTAEKVSAHNWRSAKCFICSFFIFSKQSNFVRWNVEKMAGTGNPIRNRAKNEYIYAFQNSMFAFYLSKNQMRWRKVNEKRSHEQTLQIKKISIIVLVLRMGKSKIFRSPYWHWFSIFTSGARRSGDDQVESVLCSLTLQFKQTLKVESIIATFLGNSPMVITSDSVEQCDSERQRRAPKVKLFRLCNFNLVLVYNIELDFGRQLAFTPEWHPNTHAPTHFESDQHRCHHIRKIHLHFFSLQWHNAHILQCTLHIAGGISLAAFGNFSKGHNKSDLITVAVEWLSFYFRALFENIVGQQCSFLVRKTCIPVEAGRARERYRVSNLP